MSDSGIGPRQRYRDGRSRVQQLADALIEALAQYDHKGAAEILSALSTRLSRNAVLAALIERIGLDFLLELRGEPTLASLFHPQRSIRRGRPVGRTSQDVLSLALAVFVDGVDIPRGRLLTALGRDASSGSADFRWLRLRVSRGRQLLGEASSPDPHIPALVFLERYNRDQLTRLFDEFVGYVARGARSDARNVASALRALRPTPLTSRSVIQKSRSLQ